jgi:putative transcriptional regulator
MDGPMTAPPNTRMEFHHSGAPRLAEPYHLKAVGLPNVFLLSGVTFTDDPDHGALVTFADIASLTSAIGLHIATKLTPMTGDELRFLRKQMQLTQESLANRLQVSAQTVASYEKGKTAKIGTAEQLVRVMYALHIMPRNSSADQLRTTLEAVMAHLAAPLPEPVRAAIAGSWNDALPLAA